jgi:hypothetical protein
MIVEDHIPKDPKDQAKAHRRPTINLGEMDKADLQNYLKAAEIHWKGWWMLRGGKVVGKVDVSADEHLFEKPNMNVPPEVVEALTQAGAKILDLMLSPRTEIHIHDGGAIHNLIMKGDK